MRKRYPQPRNLFGRLGTAGRAAWGHAVREMDRQGTLRPNFMLALECYCHNADILAGLERTRPRTAALRATIAEWRALVLGWAELLGLTPESRLAIARDGRFAGGGHEPIPGLAIAWPAARPKSPAGGSRAGLRRARRIRKPVRSRLHGKG